MNNPFSRLQAQGVALRMSLWLFVVFASFVLASGSASADTFSNYKAAKLVIGQSSFYARSTYNSQTTTPSAADVAISSKGVLAVLQSSGRLLLWNTFPKSNGAAADVVLGAANFTSTPGGVSASRFYSSYGVTFSPDGNKLIISDYSNNRVLIWNSVPTVNDTPADVVVGQTSMTTNTYGRSATQLASPVGVMTTPSGQLLVTDYFNNRVLLWNSIPTQNGAPADVVIGQPDFVSGTRGIAANQLSSPSYTALTPDGKLLVSDSGANSIRIWNTLPTQNGTSADVIIGQNDFSTSTAGVSATKFAFPNGMSISPTGQLAIVDQSNNRVLIYNSVPTTNGATANVVLGQPNFTSYTADNGGITAKSLSSPNGVRFLPDGTLMVAGYGMSRVLVFGNQPPTITTTTLPAARTGESYSFQIVGNDMDGDPLHWSVTSGNLPSGITLSDSGVLSGTPDTPGTSSFSVLVSDGQGDNITVNFSLKVLEFRSLVVTTTDDSVADDGVTSLREAIATANTNDGTKAYTITFADNVRGTINLKSIGDTVKGASALALLAPVDIQGPGAGLLTIRRDIGGQYRIFRVGDGITVSISGLTVTNGTDSGTYSYAVGGGIYSAGTLTLRDCVITGNSVHGPGGSSGGGIYSTEPDYDYVAHVQPDGGRLAMYNCTVSNNYANVMGAGASTAIFQPTLIENCTFANNTSNRVVAGIANNGYLTVKGSTFSGNTVKIITDYDESSAGAIYCYQGTGSINVSNSTFTGNSAKTVGAIWIISSDYQQSSITDCTFSGNRATGTDGISALYLRAGRLPFQNNLVVGDPNISTQPDVWGTFTSGGYNLIGNKGTATGFIATGDKVGDTSNPIDAKLGPLADHGGPTLTCLPLLGSPAIDAGNTTSKTDQRGAARPVGSAADIGAVEYQNLPPILRSVNIAPVDPKTNAVLRATVDASDPDNDALTSSYVWKKNGVVIENETSSSLDLSKAGNGDKNDAIVCVVTISNRNQTSSVTSNAITVQNSAPVVGSVAIDQSAPKTNDVLSFAPPSTSDVDGDTLMTTYQWKKNGTNIKGQTSATLDLSVVGNGDRGDKISVVVTATDGTTSVSSESEAVTVVNSVPVLASVSINKSAPKTNDVLSFAGGTVIDADANTDTLTTTYAWKKNGIVIDGQIGATLDLSAPGNGDKDDKISVIVTATDGTTSVSSESEAVTIVNSAPSILKVDIDSGGASPFQPKTNDVLHGLYEVNDADNDDFTVTLGWKKNGQQILGARDPQLPMSMRGWGDRGDQMTFVVSATDGTETNSAESAPVTIVNSAPAPFSVSFEESSPDTNTLLRSVLATNNHGPDDDDDAVLMQTSVWKRNGVVIPKENGTELDLSKPGRGDKGDVISLFVTRDDRYGGVTTAEGSITIQDSPTVPTSVKIAPASPKTNDVLSAVVEGTDTDGDAVAYSYKWAKNGVTIGTDSTLDLGKAGLGDKGDNITVAVSSLGTETPSVSDTVTVGDSAPQLLPAAFKGNENTIIAGIVKATDADGDALTFSVGRSTGHGQFELASDGSFNYTPSANFNGTDSFVAKVTDSSGASTTATYSLTIVPVNGVPTAGDDVIKGSEDVPITIQGATLLKNDGNGELRGEVDALKIIKVETRAGFPGSLKFDPIKQTITFTPRANWYGEAVFFYTIQDSQKATASAQVTLQIASVNDAPVAASGRLTVLSGVMGEVALSGTDVENDVLTFAVSERPSNGTTQVVKVGTSWVLRYQSTMGFTGTDTVSIIARDGKANSAPATITITVKPNNAPQLVSLTPNKGTFAIGSSVVFEQKVRDADGTTNLDAVALVPSASASTLMARGGAAIWFDAVNNRFTITKDDGKTTLTPAALGQTLENSQMRVTLGAGDVIRSSNGTLVLRWHITFKSGYMGAKSLWGRVEDLGGLSAGFSNLGQITLGTASRGTASELDPSAPNS